ncbi:8-oxo-dGTP diphosphatase [Candidatus Marsarchaeota archaeon]|nr:8-oxo-dGTP diphosphatase [Candidatus Marsarchaeota archaeon]
MALNTTICHVIKGKKILLKKASRGVSKGFWNGSGGKIEQNETPEENAKRELYEETGLIANNLYFHGTIKFFLDGSEELSIFNYLFSTTEFSGDLQSSDEGEVRWFDIISIPYKEMWQDDEYWLDLLISGKKFDAEFHFDKGNKNITKYNINIKE